MSGQSPCRHKPSSWEQCTRLRCPSFVAGQRSLTESMRVFERKRAPSAQRSVAFSSLARVFSFYYGAGFEKAASESVLLGLTRALCVLHFD